MHDWEHCHFDWNHHCIPPDLSGRVTIATAEKRSFFKSCCPQSESISAPIGRKTERPPEKDNPYFGGDFVSDDSIVFDSPVNY